MYLQINLEELSLVEFKSDCKGKGNKEHPEIQEA